MKYIPFILFQILFISPLLPLFSQEFITVWRTDLQKYIELPLVDNGRYDFSVDWGDGVKERVTTPDDKTKRHFYRESGEYTVVISGLIEGWSFEQSKDLGMAPLLLEVQQWGTLSLGYTDSQFKGARYLTITATDAPDLSKTPHLYRTFSGASSLERGVGHWDTSQVTNMDGLFFQARKFNEDLSQWNTSEVRSMNSLFRGATSFNGDISTWNLSKVEDISGILAGATSFSGDISRWDISHVTTMAGAFQGASLFNANISGWNVSIVTNMNDLFRSASLFNQDISAWDTSSVTSMRGMFKESLAFDQDISSWDVQKAILREGIFDGMVAFSFRDKVERTWIPAERVVLERSFY